MDEVTIGLDSSRPVAAAKLTGVSGAIEKFHARSAATRPPCTAGFGPARIWTNLSDLELSTFLNEQLAVIESSAGVGIQAAAQDSSVPDVLATLFATIVCALLTSLSLQEANRLGESPASLNLFELLSDLSDIIDWTVAAWSGSRALMRRMQQLR